MAAEKVPADDAETLSRLEELRREAQQVSDRSHPTPGLTFVLPPKDHPRPGQQLFDQRSGDWLDPGQWCAAVNLRMPPSEDVARYQVFLDGTSETELATLWAIANEVAKLLGRIGYDVIPEQLYFELFERGDESQRLRWELNEQPEHPETQSAVARLGDVFGEIAGWLRELLDEHQNPTTGVASSPTQVRPSDEKAWGQFILATGRDQTIQTDQQAYDWLEDWYATHGENETLPSFASWSRQLRRYRRASGQSKNSKGQGVQTRSVVKSLDIEFQQGQD